MWLKENANFARITRALCPKYTTSGKTALWSKDSASFPFGLLSKLSILVVFLKLGFSSFTMLPRASTYSPVQQIDDSEDDSATEKLGHWLNPQVHHTTSRYTSFWIHHWAYFTHGALLSVSILFFCLWMRARVQIPTSP